MHRRLRPRTLHTASLSTNQEDQPSPPRRRRSRNLPNGELTLTSASADELPAADAQPANNEQAGDNEKPAPIVFDEVVGSVYQSYPLLEAALFSRNIALGQQVGASGAFDTKLKAASENGPQGFYQTYRQNVGVIQPTYWGGEVFAGYRIGRGDFQPWYLNGKPTTLVSSRPGSGPTGS